MSCKNGPACYRQVLQNNHRQTAIDFNYVYIECQHENYYLDISPKTGKSLSFLGSSTTHRKYASALAGKGRFPGWKKY